MAENSKLGRNNPLFMRNQFLVEGKYGIPIVKKQVIPLENIKLIACSDTQLNSTDINKKLGFIFLLMIIDLKIFIGTRKDL